MSVKINQPSGGAVIKSVQRGSGIITNGTGSLMPVIPAVDISKCIVKFTTRSNMNSGSNSLCHGYVYDPTHIRFLRNGLTGDLYIEWELIEFAGGVKVQYGTTTIATTTTSITAGISSINLSKSMLFANWYTDSASLGDNYDFITSSITSATQLTFQRMGSGNPIVTIRWFVLEYL